MQNLFSSFQRNFITGLCALTAASFFTGCASPSGKLAKRKGDEIIVAGHLFHTGTKVVTWMDPGGYDAYRVERRFTPYEESDWEHSKTKVTTPNRYSLRSKGLTDEQIEKFRGGGWDLPSLQDKVDQFVLHFDVAGISRSCFKTLHDARTLSVHFMLDVDGTLYQTLDLKERAWHATTSNDRSIGIEIANMGCYSSKEKDPLSEWYKSDNGHTVMTIPERYGKNPVRTPHWCSGPVRHALVEGEVQGKKLHQYDYTPEQYKALVRLTATLCSVFPKITCDYPRDEAGKLITHKLSDEQLHEYHGVMGHYHVQTNKVDPGPALQWDYLISNARKRMQKPNVPAAVDAKEKMCTKLISDN